MQISVLESLFILVFELILVIFVLLVNYQALE